jgi:hypothetical protein
MTVSQHSSINRFAGVLAPVHQSTLNDFLNESPWEEHCVHTMLTRVTFARINDAWIGIIDDTFSHKPYAKKTEQTGWYRDGLTKEKQYGHNIVTHGVHSDSIGFVPLDVELSKKDNGRTKNDIACVMIERTQQFKKLPLYLVDSWYANKQVLGKIRREESHYVTEVKSDRNATISCKKRFVREHERLIEEKEWTTVLINDVTYRYFQTSAYFKGLGSNNLVFSQKHDEKENVWEETFYLITDILSLPGETVIRLFLKRNGIEGFHREAKQQLGLEQYQLRKSRGIERYLFLVMLTYALLLLLSQQQQNLTNTRKTIGELREEVRTAYLTTQLYTTRGKSYKFIEQNARRLAHAL